MTPPPMLEGERVEWGVRPADALDADELYEGVRSRRVFACAVDSLLLLCALALLALLGALLAVLTLGLLAPLLFLFFLPWAALSIAYVAWFLGGRDRATPGMRLMRLEAASTDGSPPTRLQAFVFATLYWFSVIPTSGLVLLVALFNPRGRCAHDFFAGLVVLRADARPRVGYAVD